MTALQDYITTNKRDVQSKIPTVFVEFVVDETGKVIRNECLILASGGTEADQEAVRLVKEMPIWQPGTVSGLPASTKMVLPVNFIPGGQCVI
jgi:TonB family protein